MALVVYILRPLALARQLTMFGQRPPGGAQTAAPQLGLFHAPAPLHREVHQVVGHTRQTQHGIVQVAPHQRVVEVASPVAITPKVRNDAGTEATAMPDTIPEPDTTPEPEPSPAEPRPPGLTAAERSMQMRSLIDHIDELERDTKIDAVTRSHAITEARRKIAALERRTVEEIVGQDATITSDPFVSRVATTAEHLEVAEERARQLEPESYTYVRSAPAEGEEAVHYLPPGASELQTLDDGSTVVTYATPLHERDREALRLRPYQRPASDAEKGWGALRPARNYFAVLDDRMEAFQERFGKLVAKAKRFKNGAIPTAEAVGTGRARVPIAVDRDAEGTIRGYRYATLPYTLMKVDGGKVQVPGGWRLQAKITPLAHGVNEVTVVGDAHGKLPDELWRSGMYCDHCKTTRDRAMLYAFQDPTGTWKRVGTSCLQDFIGMTPGAVAAMAEGMDILDDGERFDEWLGLDADVGSGWARDYMPFDAVLALASAAVEDDGGYVSRAEADKAAVMSTGDRVMRDLARPDALTRKVRENPAHLSFAREVIDWLRTQPQDTDYMRNLGAYTMAGAVNLKRKGPGLAVSAIAAYLNAKEREADAARPEAGWFGKPGEKFGPKYLPSKTGKPGQHQHAPRLVKVTKTYATMTDFGPSTKVSMVDDAGHRFVWWASGGAGDDLKPGQVVQIAGGSIKKHTAWKPRGSEVHQNETQLTRASLTPVVTAEQSRFVAERSAVLKADNEIMRAGFDAVKARMERELPEVQKAVDADPDMEGVPSFTRSRIAAKRWVESLPREDIAMIPVNEDNARADLNADDMVYRLSQHDYKPRKITDKDAEDQALFLWQKRQRRMLAQPIGALTLDELKAKEATPMAKAQVAPVKLAQQGAVSAAPAQRVRFRHPDTGEEQDGHIHGVPGPLGASVVDGRGQVHKVPHGQYLHHNGDNDANQGDELPSAEQVGQAARKHLELGPEAPLAVYGAIALLTIGGCHTPHAWRVRDVTIKGSNLLAHPDKLKTDEAPLVQLVAQLVKGRRPTDPLFVVDGKPVTEDAVTTYVRRFGAAGGLIGGRTVAPKPVNQKTPMAKASAAAYALPMVVEPYKTWTIDGDYTVALRKGAAGIESMTIEGPGLDLPLHEIVQGVAHAQQIARQIIDRVQRGRAPNRGVFFRIGSA